MVATRRASLSSDNSYLVNKVSVSVLRKDNFDGDAREEAAGGPVLHSPRPYLTPAAVLRFLTGAGAQGVLLPW